MPYFARPARISGPLIDFRSYIYPNIMLHTVDNIKIPEDNLQSLLKLFSIFNIRIWYYESIFHEDVLDSVGIICINCGKTVGCLLYNQKIEDFVAPFFTNVVFRNVDLSWIFQPNKNPSFDFQKKCLSWILNVPWYNKIICSQLHEFGI